MAEGGKPRPGLGGRREGQRRCMRWDPDPDTCCDKPAVVHIIYDWEPLEHGYACAEHWAEYQTKWSCFSSHDLGHDCGMPGAQIHCELPKSWCVCGGLPVVEVEELEAVCV